MNIQRCISLATRLQELFLDGKWIANTNYKELLRDIVYEEAQYQSGSLNTIARLTYHINYYLQGLLRAFETGKLEIRDQYSFDLPATFHAGDWETLKQNLLSNALAFVQYIQNLEDRDLDAPFIDPKYGSLLRNIEGVIEHGYYHLGQISLLRKMYKERSS